MKDKLSDDTILGMFKTIDEKLGNQDKVLSGIHEQTKKTNGNVTDLQYWKNQVQGGLTVVAACLIPVGLYLTYLVISHLLGK